MEKTKFRSDFAFTQELDNNDELREFRSKFIIPKLNDGQESIYLNGNSLGLQPRKVKDLLDNELQMWGEHGVEGHFKGTKWKDYHEYISELCSSIVGAKKSEVVIMNTLTVNLHLMMVSFYRPNPVRYKILVEHSPFPSDQYAIQSQIRFHNLDPKKALIELHPREGEHILREEDILKTIDTHGDEIALILFGGVNYLSGQVFDMESITKKGHEKGCIVGFDLAHGFANIALKLHDWSVDFAVWCTYKYGNGGPGAIAGCFVHENHAERDDLPRFAGWWGHDKETRFMMGPEFKPIKGAEGWQISNPPIFAMTPLIASFELFKEAGMDRLIKKSIQLTNYLEFLLNELEDDNVFITPKQSTRRGCQLSVHVKNKGKTVYNNLIEKGVICDWREPDVIRIAPVPLYNSFTDVYKFYTILKDILSTQ